MLSKIEKIKYRIYKEFFYKQNCQNYEEESIESSKQSTLIYNPYDDVLIKYLSDIENYTIVNSLKNVDIKRYKIVLICIYFFNHKIKRKPISPKELIENRSEFSNGKDKFPIINDEIVKLLSSEKCKLLIFTPWELIPDTASVNYSIKKLLKKRPILYNKIILSSSDFLKTNMLIKKDGYFTLSYGWPLLIAKYNSAIKKDIVTQAIRKTKRVIILNRRHNAERYICACYFYIKYHNVCHISYLTKPDSPIKSSFYNEKSGIAFYEKLPIQLDGGYDNVKWHSTDSINNYISDSFFMVIFETNSNMDGNYCQVSEKTFKGITAGMPFLLFTTSPGILKFLKMLGFKTFSPMINESYDEDFDYEDRYKLFVDEIEMLCRKSDSEIADLYDNCLPIVEHNMSVLRNGKVPFLL